jgi:hypothetical protein
MRFMKALRPARISSSLQPESHFVRTLQAPDHVVLDKATGKYRLSSKAFGPSKVDKNLSGELEQILVADGLDITALFPVVPRAIGAVTLRVGEVRALDLDVHHHPVWVNWYHGSISGIKSRHKDKLLKLARDLIEIDQAQAEKFERERHGCAGSSIP